MAGRMSACGQLGVHKYENHTPQSYINRTMNICEDIELEANV